MKEERKLNQMTSAWRIFPVPEFAWTLAVLNISGLVQHLSLHGFFSNAWYPVICSALGVGGDLREEEP